VTRGRFLLPRRHDVHCVAINGVHNVIRKRRNDTMTLVMMMRSCLSIVER
jgi:hypothetical protein